MHYYRNDNRTGGGTIEGRVGQQSLGLTFDGGHALGLGRVGSQLGGQHFHGTAGAARDVASNFTSSGWSETRLRILRKRWSYAAQQGQRGE